MARRGPERTVRDERLLLEFIVSADPAFFSSEIAENVPLSRPQVNDRLDQLEDAGLVTSKTASGRRLWWITPDGREAVASRARLLLESKGSE